MITKELEDSLTFIQDITKQRNEAIKALEAASYDLKSGLCGPWRVSKDIDQTLEKLNPREL